VKENMFFILDIASRKLQVGEEVEFQVAVSTRRVWTRSETSHFADNISRKVVKHVPGKPIGRMGNHSFLCRQCSLLVTSKRFAVALSRVAIRERCPKF